MSLVNQNELLINLNEIRNEIIISLYLGIIKEDDIINLYYMKIISDACKVNKDIDYYELVTMCSGFDQSIQQIKSQTIKDIKLINSSSFINYDPLNKYEIQINRKFNLDIAKHDFQDLYYFYKSYILRTIEYLEKNKNLDLNSFKEFDKELIKDFKKDNYECGHECGCGYNSKESCGCKVLYITENIKYIYSCREKHKLILHNLDKKNNHKPEFAFIKCDYEEFCGFTHNEHYIHGNYKDYSKCCKCCKSIELIGGLNFDSSKKFYKPDGYCRVNHFNSKNELKKVEIGEYVKGNFIADCGDIKKCCMCDKKPNIVCFGCNKYFCLDCDRKTHEPIMKKNKIMNHKRNYFDDHYIYEPIRYEIQLRTFVIKEKEKLYFIQYNNKNKTIDENKKKEFKPKILYFTHSESFIKFCKILDLLKENTDDFKMEFEKIKEFLSSMHFKIHLDTILE